MAAHHCSAHKWVDALKIKIIFLVAVLLCSLCISASARSTDISDINDGDTIFVWENGLDLTAVNTSAYPDSLRLYVDDDTCKGVKNIIPVSNASNFDVLNTEVNDMLGIYYSYNGTIVGTQYVIIKKPTPSIDVVLNSSHSDSVVGESIDSGTLIAFKVMSPLVGAYYKTNPLGTWATAKLEFTTPSGSKTYQLNNSDFSTIVINANHFYTDTMTGGDATNLAGVEAGTYGAVLKWKTPSGFGDYAAKSNAATFTIETRTISVTSEKTSVIRNNPFVVTISGKSDEDYAVFVKNAALSAQNMYPMISPSQPGVNASATGDVSFINTIGTDMPVASGANWTGSIAKVTTKADGTRPIEFNTSINTDDRTFTIKVKSIADNSKYDTVKIKVEMGAVTITASGDGSYYLGEQVTFSGTDTDSSTIYLYMTGPNLYANGVPLDSTRDTAFNSVQKSVQSDDTWEYKWDTLASGVTLDAGTYTIYAASQNQSKNNLNGVKYDTVSIVIRKPFIQAKTSSSTVAKGDKFYITGTAAGDPSNIAIWMLGKNYYRYFTETVDDNMAFSKEIGTAVTSDMASGQYFIVAQHPMYNGRLDIVPNPSSSNPTTTTQVQNLITTSNATNPTTLFWVKGPNALQGSDAAQALVDAINSADIDDTYRKLSVIIEEEKTDETAEKGGTNSGSDNFKLSEISVFPTNTTIELSTSVIVNASLSFKGSGGVLFPDSHTLEAYTALENPQWTYSLLLNDHGEEQTYSGHYLDLNGWELSYPDSNSLTVNFSVLGTTPNESTLEFQVFKVEQIDSSGDVFINGVYSANRTIGEASDDTITLSPGWNFISTPRQLASGNNTFAIFSGVDTDGRQILGYNANAETWTAKQSTNTFDSMTGIWIYANESATIHLNYATGAAATPPVKTVYVGWNAIGLSDSSATSASNALTTIEGVWKILIDYNGGPQSYGTSIINGATGTHAETRDMTPKKGYWLYATGTGTLAAISA